MIFVKLSYKFFFSFWLGWKRGRVMLTSFGGWGLHAFAKCERSPECGDIKLRPACALQPINMIVGFSWFG